MEERRKGRGSEEKEDERRKTSKVDRKEIDGSFSCFYVTHTAARWCCILLLF